MIARSIFVKNFRSIKEETLDCDPLTIMVGRNGAGKLCFLHAFDVFYDVGAPLTIEDFRNRDVQTPIEIRVTYDRLTNEELREFDPFIRDGCLMVTKRISYDQERVLQKYYAASMQIPQFAEIRKLASKTGKKGAWNTLADGNVFPGLTRVVRADEIEPLMASYEVGHQDLRQSTEKEEQFFGPKNIGGGKLDKYTKFVLIPAVKKVQDEIAGKKGATEQLLDMIVLRKVNARKDIQDFRKEYEDKIKQVYSAEKLTELNDLSIQLSKTLEKFSLGARLNLKWDEMVPPALLLPTTKATLIEDNFDGDINKKGHGLQRALILTLLQHLALASSGSDGGAGNSPGNGDGFPTAAHPTLPDPDLILAIEEPELYLHPSRYRYLAELLRQLVCTAPNAPRNQVLFGTHSPYFINLHTFDQVRVIRKQFDASSPIPHSIVTQYSLESAAREIKRICPAVDETKITRDSFKARALPVMNVMVNEGFFADAVLVVEGSGDLSCFWKLQEILKKEWPKLGIAIVPAIGKNNLDRPVIIFRGLSIPTYFVFDGGSRFRERKDSQAFKDKNQRYLRLAKASVEDFPKTQVHDHWAVFEDDLETLIKSSTGEEYFPITPAR